MFTPQEIQEKTFVKAVFGGYDMQMVDDFLEPLSEDYITLYKENAVLKSKMKVLVEKLEEYRSQEQSMRKAILSAQRTADDDRNNGSSDTNCQRDTSTEDDTGKYAAAIVVSSEWILQTWVNQQRAVIVVGSDGIVEGQIAAQGDGEQNGYNKQTDDRHVISEQTAKHFDPFNRDFITSMSDLGNDNQTENQCEDVARNCSQDQEITDWFHALIHIFAMDKFVDQQHDDCIENGQRNQQSHTNHKGVCNVIFKEVDQRDHHDRKGGQYRIDRKIVLNTLVFLNQVKGCNGNEDVCCENKEQHYKANLAGY